MAVKGWNNLDALADLLENVLRLKNSGYVYHLSSGWSDNQI